MSEEHVTTRPTPGETVLSPQRSRTRRAIIGACLELLSTRQAELTVKAVLAAAEVSEATFYRYFGDLVEVVREASSDLWVSPDEALAPLTGVGDPVARVAFTTRYFLRRVDELQTAVRFMIAATITRPEFAAARPAHRFALIDLTLHPFSQRDDLIAGEDLRLLTADLATIMSPATLFCLTDFLGFSPEAAIESAVRTASAVTAAAFSRPQSFA